MMERYWSRLRMPWLFVSLLCLIAPVFLPSVPYPRDFLEDAMGTATVIMFVLSFPISLLATPVILFVGIGLGLGPYPIQLAYLNLFLLFALGTIQWFWIVPRVNREDNGDLQILDLHTPAALGEAHFNTDFSFFDSNSKTPVERVIDDYSEKSP
jgi:hypothetical protein